MSTRFIHFDSIVQNSNFGYCKLGAIARTADFAVRFDFWSPLTGVSPLNRAILSK